MKKILNPLSVIGVFCTLVEAFAGVVLINLPAQLQNTFMWFIIILTMMIILLFFTTLNFNSDVLYAPSDFREDSSYLKLKKIINNVDEKAEEKIGEGKDSISIDELYQILDSSTKQVEKEMKNLEKILPKLLLQDGMSSTEIAEALGKSKTSTIHLLKKYINDGILKSSNQNGRTIYTLNREKYYE
jgi:biotin operon repressor